MFNPPLFKSFVRQPTQEFIQTFGVREISILVKRKRHHRLKQKALEIRTCCAICFSSKSQTRPLQSLARGPVCYNEASILLRLAEFVELVPEKPLEPFNPNKTKESIAVTDFFSVEENLLRSYL